MKKLTILAVTLFSIVLLIGCGGGGGGGSIISQTTGFTPTELGNEDGFLTLCLASKDETPFGVRRAYESKDSDDNNDIFIAGGNCESDYYSFRVFGSNQINIEWYFKRPQLINTVKIDLSGTVDTIELKYVGETDQSVLKTYKIQGQLSATEAKRIWTKDVVKGLWKVVLSLKGDNIDVRMRKNRKDFIRSNEDSKNGYLDLRNYKEIYKDENFLKNSSDLNESSRFSLAESINLTLQRYNTDPTKENIEKILTLVLANRAKYENYPFLDINTSVIYLKGTATFGIDYADYCRNIGVKSLTIIDSQNTIEAKKKFLDTVMESKGKVTVIIDSHGDKNYFEVKRPKSETEESIVHSLDLANTILDRQNLGEFGELNFIDGACYSADFIERMTNLIGRNLKTKIMAVTHSNRDQLSWDGGLFLRFLPRKEALQNPGVVTLKDIMAQEEFEFYPNNYGVFVSSYEVNNLKLDSSNPDYWFGISPTIPILDLNQK